MSRNTEKAAFWPPFLCRFGSVSSSQNVQLCKYSAIHVVMGDELEAPWLVRWVAEVLLTIPAPNSSWAEIIGHLAWPLLIAFLVLRFRKFISTYLWTIADRLKRGDHLKIGWFELRANDEVWVLDKDDFEESTLDFEASDIQRIERIFEFIATEENFERLYGWIHTNVGAGVDIEDFLTLPRYANERDKACKQVEGLAK